MDVHRKRKREATGIENIDDIKFAEHQEFAASVEIPESNILTLEMGAYLHHKIESLPDRLRHPFILHCCQDKSYQDVAKQLTISEENVRKRILKARKILQKQLKKYLAGEDNTRIDFLSPALKKDISMEEKWQSDETVICDWESLIPTNSKQEEINYKVTLICLETLPPHWYSSPNSLGWN
jgi:RNA polymerase sigma-70 factor (ECF subfamily)